MANIIFVDNELIVESDSRGIALPSRNCIDRLRDSLTIYNDNASGILARISRESFALLTNPPETINIRQIVNYFDQKMCGDIIYNLQLLNYYVSHKYCGTCSNPLARNANSIFMWCSKCHSEIYPKLSPSIIVRISNQDKILLARGANFAPNVWALIAGFVELGESLEEAVIREVREEVGIEIDNIQYWGSQSWPLPASSLMIGFTATYAGGEITVDNNEIEAAGFFTKDNLPGLPSTKLSISHAMIEEFLSSNYN